MREVPDPRTFILQDWSRNAGRSHIRLLLVLFRTAQWTRRAGSPFRALSPLFALLYRSTALFAFSIDMPTSTRVGPGLAIHHGMGLVVHDRAYLGSNVTLRQNVTIGAKVSGGPAPRLAHGVDVGVGAVVLGDVEVGESANIGAGTVVLGSIPAGATMVGNPGRLLGAKERTTA